MKPERVQYGIRSNAGLASSTNSNLDRLEYVIGNTNMKPERVQYGIRGVPLEPVSVQFVVDAPAVTMLRVWQPFDKTAEALRYVRSLRLTKAITTIQEAAVDAVTLCRDVATIFLTAKVRVIMREMTVKK